MNQEGYIITDKPGTTPSDTNYLNQYNFANPDLGKEAGWATYHSGTADLKFDCGTCHTTGYSPQGNQDKMPGVVGTWAQTGVRCEACHGPGSLHITNPQGFQMQVNRDSELCGECHRYATKEVVDAKDGFIEQNQQYDEQFQSKHLTLNCADCHDPHAGVVQLKANAESPATTNTQCENCHWRQASYQDSQIHPNVAKCVDCHMPHIEKAAWGDPAMFKGDIRAHLMAIDPSQLHQFTEDGLASLSEVSLDFACRQCHVEGGMATPKTDEELMEKAKGYHTPAGE